MLDAKHISKYYKVHGNSFTALDDVSLTLGDGEFHAIVGESGSGKTTLAMIMCGLISADKGEVLLNDLPVTLKSRKKDRRICSQIQLVLQNSRGATDPRYTVYDTIAEPLRLLKKCGKNEEKDRVHALCEQLQLDCCLLEQPASILSGGQTKRLALARAFAAEPDILILDEAVSGMDVVLRKNILDLLKQLHDETGKTFLFITHDIDAALYTASHISVMKQGKMIEQVQYTGDTDVFKEDYSHILIRSSVPEKK